ncbi:MAG: FRG domain-containing protein [Bryobacteraceae bacterium]
MAMRSRAELSAFLKGLPAPASGSVRLYRGQTRGYTNATTSRPSLLPALVRPDSAGVYDPAWLVSVQMYIGSQLGLNNDLPADVINVWAPALLQHYGPGSRFLDVTADFDVALWFAFHEHHETWIALPTRASPKFAMERWFLMAWHTEVTAASSLAPVLYVLDAPIWDGSELPRHGEAVDLRALPAGKRLSDTAMRLVRQRASLMFAGAAEDGGPDLGSRVVAAIDLTPDFDDAAMRSRTVAEVFPPPGADPFYSALLGVPALHRFNPLRMQHALDVPCYLNGNERVWEAKEVTVSSGTGERSAPLRLAFPNTPTTIAGLEEAGEYVAAGASMEPAFLHPHLLDEWAHIAGGQFEESVPLLLEGPVMTFLPGVEDELGRGSWLESALPGRIADRIGGRPTADVYVECSPLDVWYPGSADSRIAVLAARLVREAGKYTTTIFLTSPEGVFSHAEEFRFNGERGCFDAARTPPPGLEWLQARTLKALFTVLTVLRDASPGFKPPAVFSRMSRAPGGWFEFLPGTLLEPQLAIAEPVAGTPYFLVRSRSGGVYARASGQDGLASNPQDPMLEIAALGTFAAEVREPSYVVLVNLALAEKRARRGDFDLTSSAAAAAANAARRMRPSPMAQVFEAQAEIVRGRALSLLKQSGEAGEALDGAAAILRNLESAGDRQSQGAQEALLWTRALTGVEAAASAADVDKLQKQLGLRVGA